MEETFLEKLKHLYRNIEYSNSPTDFYFRVYEYIKLLWSDSAFKLIIKEDDIKWIQYDKEKQKQAPLTYENEHELDVFVKRMNHMRSGDQQFLSYYLGKIHQYIYVPFSRAEEGNLSEEFIIMRSGAKKKTLTEKLMTFLYSKNNPIPLENLNELYIDKYGEWKLFISYFHKLLLEQLALRHTNLKTEPTRYDFEKTMLFVNNVGLSVSRKSDKGNIHYILKYIFENNAKDQHFYTDMEGEKLLGDSKEWNTYYKALNTLNERLTKELGISDFFERITTGVSGSVRINSKYL